jgi:hypothetical protein
MNLHQINFIQIILLILIINYQAYLHVSQTKLINNLIQNNNLTPIMRQNIDMIIYHNYKNKTNTDAYLFYKKNYKLFRAVRFDVLKLYAQTGLIKAIRKFNGKSNFYQYSKIYVNSEMLKCISENNFNILPHSLKSSNKISKYTKLKYYITSFGSTNAEDEWKLNDVNIKIYNQDDGVTNKLLNIQIILNKFEPKIKRTFKSCFFMTLKLFLK